MCITKQYLPSNTALVDQTTTKYHDNVAYNNFSAELTFEQVDLLSKGLAHQLNDAQVDTIIIVSPSTSVLADIITTKVNNIITVAMLLLQQFRSVAPLR